MDFFSALLVEMAFTCLTGCVPTQGRHPEIRLPPKRIVQLGYSVLPPNDSGWFVLRRTPTLVALAKQGKSPDENIAIEARSHELSPSPPKRDPALVPGGPGVDVASRFSQLTLDVRDDERADCKRVHSVSEDRAPKRRSGAKDPMILEALMLSCVHPGDRALTIDVVYSHRYEPGQRDPQFDAKAAGLLQAVQLTDLGSVHEGAENVR